MKFEDYLTDLEHNEQVQIQRDYASNGHPELAGWRVVSQPAGPAQLATSPDGQRFLVALAPGPHETSATGLLLEAIAVVSGMASRLNQLRTAAQKNQQAAG